VHWHDRQHLTKNTARFENRKDSSVTRLLLLFAREELPRVEAFCFTFSFVVFWVSMLVFGGVKSMKSTRVNQSVV